MPGSSYPCSLRTPTARWWKPLVALLIAAAIFIPLSAAVSFLAVILDAFVFGSGLDADAVTPTMFAVALLSLVVLIPISWLVLLVLHHQAWGWNNSVTGRFRWRWFWPPTLALLLVFGLYLGGLTLLDPEPLTRGPDWLTFALIGVSIMPFQAAAEEIFFRGYLQRAVGSWFARERVAYAAGALASAGLFALAHLNLDPWMLLYYLAFGLTMSELTRRTGGIEAAVAVHIVNNVVAAVVVSLTTDPSRMFDTTGGGPMMLVQIVFIAGAAAALAAWGRRKGLQVRVGPGPG